VVGRTIPGGTWHEFAGRRMEVEADPGQPLAPIIDGEVFHGLDRLVVEVGPTVPVPRIPGRGFGFRY